MPAPADTKSDASSDAKPNVDDAGNTPADSAGKNRGGFGIRQIPGEVDQVAEKLLVGHWRGEGDEEFTFLADGTCEEYPRLLVPGREGIEVKGRGRWSAARADSQSWLTIQPAASDISLRSLPELEPDGPSPGSKAFRIVLLNDSLLRLAGTRGSGNSTAHFYHRVNQTDKSGAAYDSSIPEPLRRVAKFAELSPEEALAVSNALKPDASLQLFELLARLSAARNGKIDFAELFQLNTEEAAAFAELYKLTRGSVSKMVALSQEGQLNPVEARAVEKVGEFASHLMMFFHSQFRSLFKDDINRGVNFAKLPPERQRQIEAIQKLEGYISYQESFLNRAVLHQ